MKRLREPRALAFGRSVDCSLRRIAQSGRAWRSLSTTRTIAQILREAYSAEATRGWFMAPNRLLGFDRPIDRLGHGDFAAVREAAEAFVDGDYT